MKLIPVTFYGHTAVDKRFSSPMLPWIVSEIRRTQHSEKISVCVEEGCFRAYNADFELQFSHRVALMTRFSQADLDPCTFLYLFKGDFGEQQREVLYCYLFQATKATDVTDLYRQMKEQSHHQHNHQQQQQQHYQQRSISNAANLTSLCVDISPSCSSFFEVLYIGKLKVWSKKVPETFIDEALDKFRLHELEKTKKSNDGIEQMKSSQSTTCLNEPTNNTVEDVVEPINKSVSLQNISNEATENKRHPDEDKTNKNKTTSNILPVEIDDHNRTMVLQVDRTDLRLISPDRKVVLMHKHHKEVTVCMQGVKNTEHFGFVCRESNNPTAQCCVGYVFKCESQSVTTDAVQAITQAFANAAATDRQHHVRNAITSCEHCPMVWYHKLCAEVEHLSDRKTQAAIFRRIDQLDDDDQNTLLTKFRGAETDSMTEQNEFLMMLLRAHCEMKQARHVHDTAENRSEFLNQYLGGAGNTLFTKAKRSLTNSFDHLLKRKASRDDFGPTTRELSLPVTNVVSRETSPVADAAAEMVSGGGNSRSRTSTLSSQNESDDQQQRRGSVSPEHHSNDEKLLKSPMMDIFLKVGSSPSATTTTATDGSWRQAIFKRVMTPSGKNKRAGQQQSDDEEKRERKMRSREELKEMWKRAIHQAILLVRMEKENAKIKAKQEENAVKRIKLEYDEMRTNQREVMEVWDMVTNRESKVKCDNQMLLHAIRQGVPRSKRGDVWVYLAEQFCSKLPPIDTTKYPNYNVPYETWLKQLTSHQHAILIDLGRTFPSHSYYSSPLGPGQLALFNLLKAYSLLDPEVGYCQGLSFVAGVLLLHMDESQAFFLLRHLMFRRGLRKQYLPDMVALQVKLYQLSRLVRDRLPELYDHFDVHEVSPTLYAAPWLLTIFASQFPLGFVTRVFDLIFLENIDVIFRVALALLTHHKDKLLKCDSFEEIMDYLKSKLPAIDSCTLDKIMKQVFTTDVSKQLDEYKVEYQVIQEEMISVQPQIEALQRLEVQSKVLSEQNKALTAQLEIALSNVQRLEKTRTLQQANINKLEMQNRTYEVTIATLGSFINSLMEQKVDVEIPGDVRRIISQITISERRKSSDIRTNSNLMKVIGGLNTANNNNNRNSPEKAMVKSLSTGRITTNVAPIICENNVLRSNSLNTTGQQQQQQQQQPQKVSNFFSSTHTNILQKQLSQQSLLSSLNNNSTKIDIKIQDFENNTSSPTHSVDSGVGTPSSPNNNNNNSSSTDDVVHPLSNCGDVSFTFNGTRELKTIKASTTRQHNMLSRNSSPDIIGHSN